MHAMEGSAISHVYLRANPENRANGPVTDAKRISHVYLKTLNKKRIKGHPAYNLRSESAIATLNACWCERNELTWPPVK